jgi:hypothetical protein
MGREEKGMSNLALSERMQAAVEGFFDNERLKGQEPVYTNRASSIGWPCPAGARYLVLQRRFSSKIAPPSIEKQMIFREGRFQERRVIEDLRAAGLEIEAIIKTKVWPQLQISGKVDAKILHDGRALPVEIKALAPFSWDKHKTLDNFFEGKWPWLRAYPAQLLTYMMLENEERGVLLTKNKSTSRLHFLEIEMDDRNTQLVETYLKRAEESNTHFAAGTLPESAPYDETVCPHCSVFPFCNPPIEGNPPAFLEDPELEDMLEEMEDLKAPAKRLEEIKDFLKKRFGMKLEAPIILGGRWTIESKERKRKEFFVPESVSYSPVVKRLPQIETK